MPVLEDVANVDHFKTVSLPSHLVHLGDDEAAIRSRDTVGGPSQDVGNYLNGERGKYLNAPTLQLGIT